MGSALTGARLGPAAWTSTDGVAWQPAARAPGGSASPTLWAVTRLADGRLFVCGSGGVADHPQAGCWLQHDSDWTALSVNGSPTPLHIYGLAATATGVTAVGEGQDADNIDAAAWTLKLPG